MSENKELSWEGHIVSSIPKPDKAKGLKEDTKKLLQFLMANRGKIVKLTVSDESECARLYYRVRSLMAADKYGLKINKLVRRGKEVFIDVKKD